MARERLVVIGGVAAGMSAASRARRINPEMEVVVLEKGERISYGTCGLTYLVSGIVARPEDLLVYTPDFFREKRGIEVRTGHEAIELVPGQKRMVVRRGSEVSTLDYDKLVLATGGAPAEDIPGTDAACVFDCNSLARAMALRTFIEERHPKQGVVIGGGYIGLEAAEALCAWQMRVTLLERSETLLDNLEPELEKIVRRRLAAHGIQVNTGAAVSAITPRAGGGANVLYGAQNVAAADVVVLATGVVPRIRLAVEAGIAPGPTGAIAVDEQMQTNVPSIYAAGDCVEVRHLVTGKPAYVPLGTTANKQGRAAGENAAGGNATFPGVVGTLVTRVFELEVGKTGLNLAEARQHGFPAEAVAIESISRAKYFSGKPLGVNLVFDRESGRLLGGQLAGEEGAARRVDVLATALTTRMTLSEFVHLDLGYAPPFGPVYDPLLVAAWEGLKKIGRRR